MILNANFLFDLTCSKTSTIVEYTLLNLIMKQVGNLRSWCWKKIVILILSEFSQLKHGIKLSNSLSFLNTFYLGGCTVILHGMLI